MSPPTVTVEHRPEGPVASWEWALLAVLCVAFVSFWIAHYHRFLVPNGDYFEIEQTSKELWSGHLPSAYKRMPLLPILMGPPARVISAQHPYLEAALVLNIAFSLGAMLLLFIFVRRLLGWAAIAVLAVYPTLWIFQEMALAPLIEPAMGFFILLSLVLWQRRSPLQYAALFAAALTRYEAAALIPICFALNVAYEKRVLKHLLLAALASSGIAVWMALSVTHSYFGNPYLEFMNQARLTSRPSFVFLALRTAFGSLKNTTRENLELGVAVLLAAFGACASWRRHRRETLAMLSFFVVYAAIHAAYGINRPRFAYPVAWIPIFFLTMGVREAFTLLRGGPIVTTRLRWNTVAPAVTVIAGALSVVSLLAGFRYVLRWEGVLPQWVYAGLLAVVLGVVACYAALAYARSLWTAAAAALVLPAIVALAAAYGLGMQERRSWTLYCQNIEHYCIAQWLAGNMAPGERALVPFASHVRFCRDFEPDAIIGFGNLRSETEEQMAGEVEALGVTYVAYAYYGPSDWWGQARDAYFKRYNLALMYLFKDGSDRARFKRIATLELPSKAKKPPVYIYRFLPENSAVGER